MTRDIAVLGERTDTKKQAAIAVTAARALAVFALWLCVSVGLAGAAHAQANIHNGSVPLNTAQNTSASASGTLTNRGSDTSVNTVPYNGAQFNFAYSVASTGNWAGGIQYQVQGGKPMIWAQPANVTFPNTTSNGTDFASYTMTWTRGVLGLTFRVGGLDFNDGLRIQFLNNGVAYNINSSWVSATSAEAGNALAVSSISATQLRVASTLTGGASGDTSLNYVQFTVPAGVIVDEVRVISAKEAGLVSNNTIGFHDFNWLPLVIDAVNDTATGIDGVTGQANVVNVLANDTLDNPDTAGVDAATLANVTLTQVSTTNAGVTLNPATGFVSVAAGTPPGTYTVTYRICAQNSVPANCDTATATVTVAPVADLVTTKTLLSSDPTPSVGDTVTFQITVRNNGPSTATGVNLTDLLPAGLTATASNGTVSAGTYNSGTGLWTIGSLANGATATLTLQGTVNAGQAGNTITNTLANPARGNENDPTTAGDDLTESVLAVQVIAVADSGTSLAGTASTPIANVRANDTINGATATAANSTISQSGVWPAGITLNTTTGAITVAATVPAGVYSIAYQLCDLNSPVSCVTVTDTITVTTPQVDFAITKTNGVNQVFSGTTVNYTITVTNNGPNAAAGAVVRDTPGAGLTCGAANPVTITGSGVPAGSFTIADLTGGGIALGTLSTGQTATLTFSCQVN